jgi:hypothetical protein
LNRGESALLIRRRFLRQGRYKAREQEDSERRWVSDFHFCSFGED